MKRVFVDTSGWYAAADSRDPDHSAVARWLRRNTLPLITTDYVFDETITLVRIELGHPAAVRFGESLLASAAVQIVSIIAEDREGAWQIFKKFEDQRFSFTDCTSFAVMKRLSLAQALTVDEHFLLMGFVPVTQT